MNVLLVSPLFPNTYWSFRYALYFDGKRAVLPPLGLLTISALLPREWQRRLVDLNIEKLRNSDIEWADVVMISAMLVQKESLLEIIQRCQARGKKIVVGGPYVSTAIEPLQGVDHIFKGEAELTVPQFAKDFEAGQAKAVYEVPKNSTPLSLAPVPDFGLAKLRYYASMAIQFSRGCPFSCEFCDIIEIFGRVPRTKSTQQMLAELDALYRLGWRGPLFIVDDNFIGNKKNVRLFLPDLIEWQKEHDYPFNLFTEASVNLAEDDELLAAMREAGFSRVFLGIESPVEASLKEAQKSQNRGNLLQAVEKIQRAGLEVMAGFIVGFDSDPDDIFERQIEFIRESAIPIAMVGPLTALPDTQLWCRLEREGRLLGESSGVNNANLSINFLPAMGIEKLIKGYLKITDVIHQPSEYYGRIIGSLQRTGSSGFARYFNNPFTIATRLCRIFLHLGLINRHRMEFWKHFKWMWQNNRKCVPEFLRLAAIWYHCWKLSQDMKPS